MEYLTRKSGISCKESLMLMGLRIKKERKKNPNTAKDSRGIGGGVGVSTILQVLFLGLNKTYLQLTDPFLCHQEILFHMKSYPFLIFYLFIASIIYDCYIFIIQEDVRHKSLLLVSSNRRMAVNLVKQNHSKVTSPHATLSAEKENFLPAPPRRRDYRKLLNYNLVTALTPFTPLSFFIRASRR